MYSQNLYVTRKKGVYLIVLFLFHSGKSIGSTGNFVYETWEEQPLYQKSQ